MLLRALVEPRVVAVDTLAAWWAATEAERQGFALPIERAIVGGARADRVGFAFATGYAEALRALVPGATGITALCATEDGGNHPRAITTTLVADGDGYVVTGRKRWATIASEASALLVVASVGRDAAGRNQLRVVRVPASAAGVRIHASAAPFVPEIPHAAIELDHVRVPADAVLPGDGYEAYLKPFRTVEDLHVHGAVVGYLVGVALRHGFARELVERLLALATATRALAGADVRAAPTHVALAGVLALMQREVAEIEAAWAAAPDDEAARWLRDRPLLRVAEAARAARRARAWTLLAADEARDRVLPAP